MNSLNKIESSGGGEFANEHSRLEVSIVPDEVLLFAVAASPVRHLAGPLLKRRHRRESFSSPDAALQALVSAAEAKDRTAMGSIFGSDYDKLLSGDQVEDDKDLNDFSQAVEDPQRSCKRLTNPNTPWLWGKITGPRHIPIIQKNGKWQFDTTAGLDEVVNRRVGENELAAIQTCRAYAVAQWEYYTEGDWDHDGVSDTPNISSAPPENADGLFWETAEDQKPSPLGPLVAAARGEGYGPKEQTTDAAGHDGSAQEAAAADHGPYYGYYVRILTRQGPHAPGGKYGYIINGNMIAGYALVAYPEKWGSTGVMTFIINQQGRVYEKNLGASTEKIARSMTAYDPDATWKLVDQQ